jgi:hypothetical protein
MSDEREGVSESALVELQRKPRPPIVSGAQFSQEKRRTLSLRAFLRCRGRRGRFGGNGRQANKSTTMYDCSNFSTASHGRLDNDTSTNTADFEDRSTTHQEVAILASPVQVSCSVCTWVGIMGRKSNHYDRKIQR